MSDYPPQYATFSAGQKVVFHLIQLPLRLVFWLGLELLKLFVLLKLLTAITGCAASSDTYARELELCVQYAKTEAQAQQCVSEVQRAWAH